MYGPVPTGCSPIWSFDHWAALVGLWMAACGTARYERKTEFGLLRRIVTVSAPLASMEAISPKQAVMNGVSALTRSRAVLTAWASQGVPSWNMTPGRSVKLNVVASSDAFQAVA